MPSFGFSTSRAKLSRSPDLHSKPRLSLRSRSLVEPRLRRLPFFVLLAAAGLFFVVYKRLSESSSPALTPKPSLPPSSNQPHVAFRHAQKPLRRQPTVIPSSNSPFLPPDHPLPVHHEERLMIYNNTPVAPSRPSSNQFLLDPAADLSRPVVALITSTNNPRREVLETATTVLGQSLQNLLWVVVDDHSDQAESLALLKDLAKDSRVVLLQNRGAQGLAAGRNVGLDWIFSHFSDSDMPPYLVSLDDDDLFEFTALEKSVWMLESNPEWDIAGFRYIKWGASNETVMTGLHSGLDNFKKGNFVPNTAVYTSRSVKMTGCRYDEFDFKDGGEDWDFWMCLAEQGFWGGTILEPLYWYRVNSPKFRSQRWGNTFISGFEALKSRIQKKHARLNEPDQFPAMKPKRNVQLEPVVWEAPYESGLAHTDKNIVFVVPWLYVGGADIGALHMIQLYAEAGYRVTLVCTLSKVPEGIELRPQVLQYTHDVHILPSFLRAHDFPRYLKHLVRSRGAKQVVLSNSQLVYEMLPALVEQLPDVEFIDYLHNEAYDGWKSGGYPRYSLISQRYLARTLTCSHYLKHWLLENGHLDPSRIGVVKLGIETAHFHPPTPLHRDRAKANVLGLDAETIVITFVGRLDPQKRPTLVPRIAAELYKAIDDDFVIVMLGDGDLRKVVEREVSRLGMEDFVRVLGTKDDPTAYYEASDMFLLPSMSEGLSIAVAEAMAMGLPIVTARAGALPEQLGELDEQGHERPRPSLGGILVDHELDMDFDAIAYASALKSLIVDPALRRRLGANARKLVESGFDWRSTLSEMFVETERAQNIEGHAGDGRYPHPAAYLATQMLLCETWKETDMLGNYPW